MSSPDGKSPGDNIPGDNVPGDSVPEDQTPGDNAPEGNVTGTTVPGDIATGDKALGVYMPTDNILTSTGDQVAGDVISTLEDTVPEDNVIEEHMTSPNAISSTDLSWLCASGPSTSPTTTDYGATRLQHSIGRCHKQMDQARNSYQLYLRLHDVLRFGLHFLAGEFGTLEAQLIKIKIQHDVTQNAVKEVCDSISGSIKDMPPMDRKEVPFPFLQHPAKREQLNFIKLLLAALSGTGAHNDSNIRNNLHIAATIFSFHERTEEITYLGGLCRNLETSDQQYMREEIRKLKPSVSRIASDVFPDLAADVWDTAVERIDKFIDHTKPLIEGLGSEVARMREIMHLAGYETVAGLHWKKANTLNDRLDHLRAIDNNDHLDEIIEKLGDFVCASLSPKRLCSHYSTPDSSPYVYRDVTNTTRPKHQWRHSLYRLLKEENRRDDPDILNDPAFQDDPTFQLN